jgi:hypothetical protein
MRPTHLMIAALAAAAGGLALGWPAAAHHAVQAQFNVDKTDAFDGVLTRVELVNPHPQIYFDVKGDKGAVTAWRIEAPAIAALRRMGLMRILKVGTTYKVEYSPARNGEKNALLRAIITSDGKRYGGSLQDVTQ